MYFYKYHALGNDYLVIEPQKDVKSLTKKVIQIICHRNYGIGSDGILFGPFPSKKADFKLRIFNPDGNEAEKSGNGTRIFSRHLWERKLVGKKFSLETVGGIVLVAILNPRKKIQIDMGKVTFAKLNKPIKIKNKSFMFTAASIGNPHCVIVVGKTTPELAKTYGPFIETHKFFPKKTNVQFMQIINRRSIKIEIWERGAGYTLASGSSSSAAAAVARKLDLVDQDIIVHMPGGNLSIQVNDDFSVRMTGPVTKIAEGVISKEVSRR